VSLRYDALSSPPHTNNYSSIAPRNGDIVLKVNMSPTSLFLTLLILSPFSVAEPTAASSDQAKGLAIATRMKASDRGWGDNTATMEMILHSGKRETHREMRVLALEVIDDGDKSMTIFDSPNDVKGTAFLTYTHVASPDDQWLYLPALKRVKRISSKNKSGLFMGSEFSYEDLSSFEVDQYDYRWLRDEHLNEQLCYVIESVPRDKYSGYKRQLTWIDQTHLRPLKIEFYDLKNRLLKTLILNDYQQYLDKYWRPGKQSMVNHQNDRRTEIMLRDYQFSTGLSQQDFTENSLKRSR
jgi:outer membrane lipoprotein-sorting protein